MQYNQRRHEKQFSNKIFLIVMIALIVTSLIDISVVKINDLINKDFIPIQSRLVLFSVNSSLILFLQFFIIRYVRNSFNIHRLNKILKVRAFYIISLTSLSILAALIGFLIFQQFYNNYYDTALSISIITISYGIAATLVIWLSLLFFSWYKSNHSLMTFLYFISMLIIAFNLVMTAAFADAKIIDRPSRAGEYVGSSGDISGGKHLLLDDIYRISTFISFFSIWITTALLMNHYREKPANAIIYWIILSIPLVYFIVTYFYQIILSSLLISYLEIDPITVSMVLGAFLSLSKPIGGLVFGVAFWNISRIISYEKNIKTSMVISGWGILLIFGANQAVTLIVDPYPPFGLSTTTILVTGAFLVLIGIYNSASLVSVNNILRRSIMKHTLESRLLGIIGQAEMENEMQKTVKKLTHEKSTLMTEQPVELDEKELKKYIDHVIREVKKEHKQ
ncbi:MAG: hypothetical protein JO297_08705 [Nitrososphaeraceae archaeon]|nr:hypothetical protein [Nitrososphaeraceae archaeon]